MEEEIRQLLLRHPRWREFINEYGGVKCLIIPYHGIDFLLFNEVGGSLYTTVLWESVPVALNNIEMVRRFQDIARQLFNS